MTKELCKRLDAITTAHPTCPAFVAHWEPNSWAEGLVNYDECVEHRTAGLRAQCPHLLRIFLKSGDEVEKCFADFKEANAIAREFDTRRDEFKIAFVDRISPNAKDRNEYGGVKGCAFCDPRTHHFYLLS